MVDLIHVDEEQKYFIYIIRLSPKTNKLGYPSTYGTGDYRLSDIRKMIVRH
jgi:hypothetical protein